jgi:hypothetical protein
MMKRLWVLPIIFMTLSCNSTKPLILSCDEKWIMWNKLQPLNQLNQKKTYIIDKEKNEISMLEKEKLYIMQKPIISDSAVSFSLPPLDESSVNIDLKTLEIKGEAASTYDDIMINSTLAGKCKINESVITAGLQRVQ